MVTEVGVVGVCCWRVRGDSMSRSMSDSNQIIKQSLCFRAKYRVKREGSEGIALVVLPPLSVVPHPKNRGGDPVNSLRTMQLNGTVAKEGYDRIEANSNGVAVEEKPAVAGGSGTMFQDAFEKNLKSDPGMFARGEGIVAIAGSLSHSHLNCAMRNIIGGKFGCECPETRQKCECASSPILDEKGRYSLVKVQAHDADWGQDCLSGNKWEMLSHKMDDEEPDAALIISIALNKKNEASMKIGHAEIFKTLVGLVKPGPQEVVKFEPVRDKLVELYGSAVDHPDFVNCFKVVCDAGGAGSVHLQDLHEFTSVYVNSKLRKMRMEAYGVLAPYPVEFPRLKNACLKWAWKQTTNKGWCQLPPNILHRVSEEGKHNMHNLMLQVESAMLLLSKFASAVVEDLKAKTKWIAELEITLVSKIAAVPKTVAGKTVSDQQEELLKECAEFIAGKLITLRASLSDPTNKNPYAKLAGDSDLMKKVCEHLVDGAFEGEKASSSKDKGKGNKSEVTETLEPKVIVMDEAGRPLTQHATVEVKKATPVSAIPWLPWLQEHAKRNTNEMAKTIVSLALGAVRAQSTTAIPLALVKKGSSIRALATKVLEKGELAIPVFFKKQSSLAVADEAGVTIHPNAVCAVVSWIREPTAEEVEAGMEGSAQDSCAVHVQPELKFPSLNDKGVFEWAQTTAVHPFWFIKRSDKNDEPNMEVKHQEVTSVFACSFSPLNESLKVPLAPATDTFTVSMPFIVNTRDIQMNQEVILKANPIATGKKKDKTPPTVSAFDQLAQQDKKKRRTTPARSG